VASLRKLQSGAIRNWVCREHQEHWQPSQDKDMQTASFLTPLLKGLRVFEAQNDPGKTSNRPVNRILPLKKVTPSNWDKLTALFV
jgi:hypothetical protein